MKAFQDFLSLLSKIPDPRRKEGKLYGLAHVLLFAILAITAGANSYRGVHTFITTHLARLNAAFGLSWRTAPVHSAIRYIIKRLDPQEIEQVFRTHAKRLESLDGGRRSAMAIDAKTLRRSFDSLNDRAAARILSAFSTQDFLILGHAIVDDESNEIPAAQQLLSELDLEGRVVTLDAEHCQKKTLKIAADAKAQMIVQLKDNQPGLKDRVEALAASAKPVDAVETRDKGHGRDETRAVAAFDARNAVAGTEWQGLVSSIAKVVRTTHKKVARTGLWKTSREVAYYLSARPASAEAFARDIRGHWGIENRNHYPRDGAFGEDASRIRVNPSAFAILRSFAYNLLRVNKVDSFVQDRLRMAFGGLEGLLGLVVG